MSCGLKKSSKNCLLEPGELAKDVWYRKYCSRNCSQMINWKNFLTILPGIFLIMWLSPWDFGLTVRIADLKFMIDFCSDCAACNCNCKHMEQNRMIFIYPPTRKSRQISVDKEHAQFHSPDSASALSLTSLAVRVRRIFSLLFPLNAYTTVLTLPLIKYYCTFLKVHI